MKKILVFFFGVISYLIGVSALLGWIVVMLGVVPFSEGPLNYSGPSFINILIALSLTSLFAVQHTIMARESFKVKITKLIPVSAERALFVLLTGVILWAILILWPVNSEIIWAVDSGFLSKAIYGFAIFGWAYLFIASFAINHFELFGLEQVYRYLKGKDCEKVPFKERLMYKFDRHPIMTGAIIGMWATPVMRLDHLIFSIMFTIYIVIGVSIEERDLIRQWGDSYRSYKKRVKSIVPIIGN